MSELLKVLLNVRSLRAALRDLSIDQIEDAKLKFEQVYQERVKEEEAGQAERAARMEKLEQYRALLAQDGIDPSELVEVDGSSSKTSTRSPRPPKYRYINENGEERTWTGQGRQPVPIRDAITNGRSIKDFLIEPEAEQ